MTLLILDFFRSIFFFCRKCWWSRWVRCHWHCVNKIKIKLWLSSKLLVFFRFRHAFERRRCNKFDNTYCLINKFTLVLSLYIFLTAKNQHSNRLQFSIIHLSICPVENQLFVFFLSHWIYIVIEFADKPSMPQVYHANNFVFFFCISVFDHMQLVPVNVCI